MKPPVPENKRLRFVMLIIAVVIVIVTAMFYSGKLHNKPAENTTINADIAGVYLPTTQRINDFHLTDNKGNAFTKKNLEGHWSLLFFGFTNCGNVCPTTMSAMNKMYQTLQKELPSAQLPQVVLVSVDPDRDNIKKMDDYVKAFNPTFIGVRGDLQQISGLEKDLHLVVVRMQAGDDKNQYTINHSAEIMVFDPKGELRAYLSYPHQADALVHDYKQILSLA